MDIIAASEKEDISSNSWGRTVTGNKSITCIFASLLSINVAEVGSANQA